jgi:FKBP-type peptidyl-prolyl cis-trans isomerase FkpA
MKKLFFIAIAFLATGVFLTSCNKGVNKHPGFKKTADGLYYKFYHKSNDTTQAKLGEFCEVQLLYGAKTVDGKDTLLFDSRTLPENRQPVRIPVMKSLYPGDIYEGVAMMHVGDSAKFYTNADSVFTKLFRMPKVPAFVDSTADVYFTIKLLAVKTRAQITQEAEAKMKKAQAQESVDREAYLKAHHIKAKPTKDGLYFISKKTGHGPHPKAGELVTVNYTGYLLNGKKFDSSYDRKKPFQFTIGKHQVIEGWDEGIAMMRKGGTATLIIPSSLAYGPRSVGPIPAFSTLVFDVKLENIQKAPAPTKKK